MATISASDQKKLNDYTAAWHAANARGDKAAMDAAHKGAEAVRAGYGYSGGSDGTQNIKISTPTTTTSTTKSSGGSSGKTYTSSASNTGIRYTNVSGGSSSGSSSGGSSSSSRGSSGSSVSSGNSNVWTPNPNANALQQSLDWYGRENGRYNPISAVNYPDSMDYYVNRWANSTSEAEKQHWGQVLAAKQLSGSSIDTNQYNHLTGALKSPGSTPGYPSYNQTQGGTAGGVYPSVQSPATGQTQTGGTPIFNALGTYFDATLHANRTPGGTSDKILALQNYWAQRQAAGASQSELNDIHNMAESLRSEYGYSGGADGSMYIPVKMEEDILPKTNLPTYQPQIVQTNDLYDSARASALAALEAAYNNSKLELDRYAAQIPSIYQERANQLAAQAAKERQQLNEYSAYNGLNAGSGSQAALALQNQMQNTMGQIRTAEANAAAEAQYQLSALYTEYQGKIASAIANNEYERAAALLAEYKEAQQSIVSVAQAQANLDMNIANFNKDTRFTNWQKQMALAEAMAANGDFSGYGALGLSSDQTNNMRRGWLAQNPEAAIALGFGGYR